MSSYSESINQRRYFRARESQVQYPDSYSSIHLPQSPSHIYIYTKPPHHLSITTRTHLLLHVNANIKPLPSASPLIPSPLERTKKKPQKRKILISIYVVTVIIFFERKTKQTNKTDKQKVKEKINVVVCERWERTRTERSTAWKQVWKPADKYGVMCKEGRGCVDLLLFFTYVYDDGRENVYVVRVCSVEKTDLSNASERAGLTGERKPTLPFSSCKAFTL